MNSKSDTYIIGHINPDTDAICAAIAYAELRNKLGLGTNIALRAGELSEETKWVLSHFGVEEPLFMESIAPQLSDVELQKIEGLPPEATIKDAMQLMKAQDVSTLPVLSPDNKLVGIIGLKDLAINYIDSFDTHALSNSNTPFENIAHALNGTLIYEGRGKARSGSRIMVGAGNDEAIRAIIKEADIVIVSNRRHTMRAVIEAGADCMIVCLDTAIPDDVLEMAKEHQCAVISTYFDSYKASYFINQAVPVSHYMISKKLRLFHMSNYTDDVVAEMNKTRHNFFPVLDDEGTYKGFISRYQHLSHAKRRLILVDHNERSQCIQGWENAEILEIVDHHRVGGIQTMTPIFFRNEPVGSTSTIISEMFKEEGIVPDRKTAGLMCCAIISDTLLFRSPTCSELDREHAKELAALADEDMFAMAEAMFEAGEKLDGMEGEDLLGRDFKVYSAYGIDFGVAQSTCISKRTIEQAEKLTAPVINSFRVNRDLRYMFYLVTDVRQESSYVFCAGEGAGQLVRSAFGLGEESEGEIFLKGVVSRKKQFIPAVLEALQAQSSGR